MKSSSSPFGVLESQEIYVESKAALHIRNGKNGINTVDLVHLNLLSIWTVAADLGGITACSSLSCGVQHLADKRIGVPSVEHAEVTRKFLDFGR